ncbi:Lon protease family protein [Hydrogenimonas urashimensis]|uniref:Lon protease family protein n=1 Tax=Hydrogenimonas urashimensis TaxID=2740515 RepID=UPI0019154707|nr:ATP-binding protein [Hydrogenimonas urashimensis]
MATEPLGIDTIDHRCDPDIFGFETTKDVEAAFAPIGQERAIRSLEFEPVSAANRYNVYVMGPGGLGKHEFVEKILQEKARSKKTPRDICYVNNFDEPNKPVAVELEPGLAKTFRSDIEKLVENLKNAIPAAFESDAYHAQRKRIDERFKNRSEEVYKSIEEEAKSMGMAMLRTPAGIVFVPHKENGELMNPKEFQALPPEVREEMERRVDLLNEHLGEATRELMLFRKELFEKIKELNIETTKMVAGDMIETIKKRYEAYEKVQSYLEAFEKDVVENVQDFLFKEEQMAGVPQPFVPLFRPSFTRYEVNILVSHDMKKGAPVIYEDNPSYENIVGRIEHIAQMGTLITDFTLIRPGSLHKARGGYLIIDARKILVEPFAWETLKRALMSEKIKIVPKERMIGLISTLTLEPEPVPLDIKVVLVGSRLLYYLLYNLDPDFKGLFNINADFDEIYDRDDESLRLYASLIASIARKGRLNPLTKRGVARTIDYSSRLAEDARKLSLEIKKITNMLEQADYFARKRGSEVIDDIDIDTAIEEIEYRSGRIKERILEEFERGIVKIDIEGAKRGQVNGLSVIDLGEIFYGKPVRITAVARMGKGEVIDIEKESELGGKIFSKSIMIVTGFLKGRYVPDMPLTLTASLVFEQSYSGVEGDSASLAETCALLSAIAQVPIRQNIAITGSMSQKGDAQAIGGVNEKIEGFFEVCKLKGLTGDQGVIIPKSNIDHLMLKKEVLDAIGRGEFHLYAVENIDEAIEILTNLPAGKRGDDGKFSKGSVNRLVEDKLTEFAKKAKEIMRGSTK